jgi:hypothetical protein
MNHHLTDATLRELATHSLSGEGLLSADDHLAGCSDCRGRLSQLGGASARLSELGTGLLALDAHLSEEDVQRYAGGDLAPFERAGLERHLRGCPYCADEVGDLERWIASHRARKLPYYLAAAAAIVLAFIVAFAAGRRLSNPTVAGLDALPDDARARVETALEAGVAEPPDSLREIASAPEVLMGTTGDPPFRLVEPLGTVTLSDRPEFRWEPLAGAESYEIAVLDSERGNIASEATLKGTSFRPLESLARDRIYVWQVTARIAGGSVTVPTPPASMARFRVMEEGSAEAIERLSRAEPDAHLLLGVLCALSGARSEAESHLLRVPPSDPQFELATRTLRRLRSP